MSIDLLFAGVPVSDLASASEWYKLLFGRAHDITVNEEEVMWQITSSGWLYLVVDHENAGHSLVTVGVRDLDTSVSEIADRGLRCAPIEIVGSAGRKASFSDPDGNVIAYIEVRAA